MFQLVDSSYWELETRIELGKEWKMNRSYNEDEKEKNKNIKSKALKESKKYEYLFLINWSWLLPSKMPGTRE